MRLLLLLLLITLLPTTAARAQSEDRQGGPAEPSMRMQPAQPQYRDTPRLPSERNERFAPRPRPGQSEPMVRERQPLFERRDPRAERYGNVESRRGGYEPRDRVDSDLNRAVEQVQAQHGGKILSADRMRHRGQDVYRVKVLTPDGRVKTVQLPDPQANPPQSEEPR